MKKVILIAATAIIFLITGCGGPASGVNLAGEANKGIIQDEPDWYSDLPYDDYPNWILGKGEANSRSKQIARQQSVAVLVANLGQQSKTIVEGRTELFQKETGLDADSEILMTFENSQKTVMNGAVNQWQEIKSETVIEKTTTANGKPYNIYRCYTIGGVDKGLVAKRMMEKLKNQQAILTEFEKTKAFEDLQKDLEKYQEQFKDNF
jgi:hypothetical protein